MSFLDKAKRLAEQAQAKLDEAQQQFNSGRGQDRAGGPAVDYDQHGRAVTQPGPGDQPADADPGPPHGDPLAGAASPPTADSDAAKADPGPPHGDPLAHRADDHRRPSDDPPPLTGGDPLAG